MGSMRPESYFKVSSGVKKVEPMQTVRIGIRLFVALTKLTSRYQQQAANKT